MRRVVLAWTMGVVLIFVVWWLASAALHSGALPGPAIALRSFLETWDQQVALSAQTAREALGGLLLAIAGSALIVACVGLWPSAEAFFYPYTTMLKASPAVAFVPVFVVIGGSGTMCKVLVSAMIAFFPLVVSGIDGIRGTPDRYRAVSHTWGASRIRALLLVLGPCGFAGFLNGLKTAAPLAVVGAIVGEYVAGGVPPGIGTFIMTHYVQNQLPQVFAGVISATLVGMIYFGMAHFLERWVVKGLHLAR